MCREPAASLCRRCETLRCRAGRIGSHRADHLRRATNKEKAMTTFVDLGRDINELKPSIIALRRELHQHPELAFEEVWTAATLAAGARGKEERMTEAGILSIMRRGHTYQVRYASSNPYDMD